jgi:hypothetical protein
MLSQSNATLLYNQWKSMAIGQNNKLLVAYGQPDSWSLGYNLFADKWLDLNMVDTVVYSLTRVEAILRCN